MAREHRRLAAIVLLDVVGYSRLMGLDEGGTLAALKANRRELIDPKTAEHDGRIVKGTGDGLLLEFPSVVDAVRCAVDVQRGMVERNAGIAPDQRLEFRIGINVGDIIIDGDDIFGDGVNIAARLEGLADPGGICVSRVVRDQVLDKLSFTFEDLGAQQVKNIVRPVEVYRIRDEPTGGAAIKPRPVPNAGPRAQPRRPAAGWRWWATGVFVVGLAGIAAWLLPQFLRPAPASIPPALSIAVLPFTAPGGTSTDDEFADTLTQDVTTALGRWRWATVASAKKLTGFKGREIDARAVGRDLNVRYLVDGETRRSATKIAVTVHLIDAESGTNAWSDKLEFEAAHLAQEQTTPATRVARRLHSAIYEAEMRRASAHPVSGSAWDLVLRGDVALNAGGDRIKNAHAARSFYDEALRVDPNFVPALLSVLSTVYNQYDDLAADRSQYAQQIDEVDKLTGRAVAIDPNDASAWFVRSQVLVDLKRLDEALAANAKAEGLDPFNPTFTANRANILLLSGRPDEALPLAEQAVALDRGLLGEEAFSLGVLCWSNVLLGRYGEALQACEKAAARDDSWSNQVWLVAGYAQQGNMAKASIAKMELLKRQPRFTIEKIRSREATTASAEYLQLLEIHLLAGLRKAGLPDR